MKSSTRTLRQTLLASLALLALAGCSRLAPTAPDTGTVSEVTSLPGTGVTPDPGSVPPPPNRLTGPAAVSNPRGAHTLLNWLVVVEQIVVPLVDTRVAGGRYELEFKKKSLDEVAIVSIKQYDPDVIDVTFGPHGIKFGEPVTLNIDFRGTVADPKDEKFDGSEPVLYWLNEDTMRWEEVPGRTDWEKLRHTVQLEHFSRYVLGGKAGWQPQPSRETN